MIHRHQPANNNNNLVCSLCLPAITVSPTGVAPQRSGSGSSGGQVRGLALLATWLRCCQPVFCMWPRAGVVKLLEQQSYTCAQQHVMSLCSSASSTNSHAVWSPPAAVQAAFTLCLLLLSLPLLLPHACVAAGPCTAAAAVGAGQPAAAAGT